MERTFTAHVELADGSYHSFTVVAASFSKAYKLAAARTDPKHTLQGVTEA